MKMNNSLQRGVALVAALTAALPMAVSAQVHRGNVLQRHPNATGAAAGIATHHALKVSARHKKARHQKLNFAERHPTITGIGAALGAHHLAKHSHR